MVDTAAGKRRVTIACNGAAVERFYKWIPNSRRPLMRDVIALALGARFGLERVALRFCF